MPTTRDDILAASLRQFFEGEFSETDWGILASDLGEDLGSVILRHDRLLRSLRFGDPDYELAIVQVLTQLRRDTPGILDLLTEDERFEPWLRKNDPSKHAILYGAGHLLITTSQTTSFNTQIDIDRFITRITDDIHTDPEAAIGSAKEMVEAVLKNILIEAGEQNPAGDVLQLMRRVQAYLQLHRTDVAPTAEGYETIVRTLSNLGQLVQGIAELRNSYGTGHGAPSPSGITGKHARLAVGSAATLATFLMETLQEIRAGRRSGPF